MENIIIKKKKFWPTIGLLLFGFFFLMFFSACILGLIRTHFDYWFDYIFLLFFLIISIIGLINIIKGFNKVLSNYPALELNNREIIIYDSPKYNAIPYSDMIEANVYSTRYSWLIGISFLPSSKYGSYLNNFQRKIRNISKEKSKIIFISLEMADVKAEYLRDLINKRIEMNDKEK